MLFRNYKLYSDFKVTCALTLRFATLKCASNLMFLYVTVFYCCVMWLLCVNVKLCVNILLCVNFLLW